MQKFLHKFSWAYVSTMAAVWCSLASKALALDPPEAIPGISGDEDISGVTGTIGAVIVDILDLVLFLGVVFIIVAGIRLIISGGDEGAKDAAKKTIIYVIAGIIIIFFARTIVAFTVNALG